MQGETSLTSLRPDIRYPSISFRCGFRCRRPRVRGLRLVVEHFLRFDFHHYVFHRGRPIFGIFGHHAQHVVGEFGRDVFVEHGERLRLPLQVALAAARSA